MELFFTCSNCGKYPVDKSLMEAAISPQLREKLAERQQVKKVCGAVLHFKGGCPRCEPAKEHLAELEIETDPQGQN
jgi:hypothetical protein